MIPAVLLHIGLNCRNQDITGVFYEKYFGFTKTRTIDVEGGEIIFLSSGNISLELFKADGEPPDGEPQRDGTGYAGYRHMAFQVADIHKKIEEMGDDANITFGPIDLGKHIKGWEVVWVRDPDGRIIEISQGYSNDG